MASVTWTETRDDAVQRWWTMPAVLALMACAALAIDASVARSSIDEGPLKALRDVLRLAELFGHGVGVVYIAVAIWTLDPAGRRSLGWLAAGAWGAGIAANVAKMTIARLRPYHWLEQPNVGGVWNTFVGWFPFGAGGSGMQSFPSAHTATAVGMALVLSAIYPRGRWFFATLALLAGLQRITAHAHFPSDVLFGAAIGWTVGAWCAARVRPAAANANRD
jgi:membrane-associated phospholipid phosphatase